MRRRWHCLSRMHSPLSLSDRALTVPLLTVLFSLVATPVTEIISVRGFLLRQLPETGALFGLDTYALFARLTTAEDTRYCLIADRTNRRPVSGKCQEVAKCGG